MTDKLKIILILITTKIGRFLRGFSVVGFFDLLKT